MGVTGQRSRGSCPTCESLQVTRTRKAWLPEGKSKARLDSMLKAHRDQSAFHTPQKASAERLGTGDRLSANLKLDGAA